MNPMNPSQENKDVHIDDVQDGDSDAYIGENDEMVEMMDDGPLEYILDDEEDLDEPDWEDLPKYIPDPNLNDDAVHTLLHHTDAVTTVRIHPTNPNIILSGSCDESVLLHNLGNPTPISLTKHTDSISSIHFNHNQTLLATAAMDTLVHIIDVNTLALLHSLEGPSEDIEAINWHPKGNVLLIASKDATIWMWHILPTPQVLHVLSAHADAVTSAIFIQQGKKILSSSLDGSVNVFSPKTGETLLSFRSGLKHWHTSGIISLAANENTPIFATGDEEGVVCVSNYETGHVLTRLECHYHSVESVGFSAMNLLLSSGLDGRAIVRECGRFDERCLVLNNHVCADGEGKAVAVEGEEEIVEGITRSKWHPDGLPYFVTVGMDATVRVFDGRDGKMLRCFTGHQAGILDVDWIVLEKNAYGETMRIVTASDDNSIKIFHWEHQF